MKIYSPNKKIPIKSLLLLFTRQEAQKLCLELEKFQAGSADRIIFETVDENGNYSKSIIFKKQI